MGLTEWGDFAWTEPLPAWVTEIRPHQTQALAEIMDAYADDVPVVVLSAPTGSGKTLIGEMVRRLLGARGLYVCHGKSLQAQFVKDFDAPVLMGRANYTTALEPDMTTDECMGRRCPLCPGLGACPYLIAKDEARTGNPAVLNTSYFLSEANGPGQIVKDRDLIVVDECDTLESELMRWAEFRVGPGAAAALGMSLPRKSVHWTTILDWLRDYRTRLQRRMRTLDPYTDAKKVRQHEHRIGHINRMFLTGDTGEWVRVYDRSDSLILKPILVDRIARANLWRHSPRFLLMSATVIGAEAMLGDLGYEGDMWREVQVPSTFPAENRPIYPVPVATMTRRGQEAGDWDRAVKALGLVLAQHPDDRILVHTVSYELTRMVMEGLAAEWGERMMSYAGADDRARALARYRAMPGGVLVAPSMDRGIDLPGDMCRVQVVMKLPYPYLGDQQVNKRLHDTEGGELWYQLETIRTLVQMTGRGVRNADDHAVTYVLDRQFAHNLDRWKKWLPDWWTEAVRTDVRPSSLIPGLRSI